MSARFVSARSGRRAVALLLGTVAALLLVAGTAVAHPLGNATVNRAIVIRVGPTVGVTAVLDLAEIPAFQVIRDLDTDADDVLTTAEGAGYAAETCRAWGDDIVVTVDGADARLEPVDTAPALTFPPGAGGLSTLRLECRFQLDGTTPGSTHRIELRDGTIDERSGWREVTAVALGDATLVASDVPPSSPTEILTAYPEDDLGSPLDVRAATVEARLGSDESSAAAQAAAGPVSQAANDPLAALAGGSLSPGTVILAIALSLGLGAAHALSPGHGKTLVAAYVLGAGGSARSAIQIGIWVAISHTAGVLGLGVVTLVASRSFLPERIVDWLSLASGVTVIGLGLVLLLGLARRRLRERSSHHPGHRHQHHGHGHGHGHGHEHPHEQAGGRPAPRELTWRGAVALGFAGGAVPSASALIVLLVALATDRIAFGVVLIACFGIGMAAVLGGLALAVARLRDVVSGTGRMPGRPVLDLVGRIGPAVAAVVVLATGLAFTVAAASRLA